MYASLEDGELEEIAADADSLTESQREHPGPVMVGRYRDSGEAMIAKSMLDSAGIECFLGDENLVRIDWFYSNLIGGIKLMVREEDADTARKLLEENIPEKSGAE